MWDVKIKRIRNLPCMNKKFVPQFFADTKKRRNNKDFENVKRMNLSDGHNGRDDRTTDWIF